MSPILIVDDDPLFLRQQTLATEQGIHAIQFSVSQDAGLKQVRNEAEKQLFLQVWHLICVRNGVCLWVYSNKYNSLMIVMRVI